MGKRNVKNNSTKAAEKVDGLFCTVLFYNKDYNVRLYVNITYTYNMMYSHVCVFVFVSVLLEGHMQKSPYSRGGACGLGGKRGAPLPQKRQPPCSQPPAPFRPGIPWVQEQQEGDYIFGKHRGLLGLVI